jgi:hypothetical protein
MGDAAGIVFFGLIAFAWSCAAVFGWASGKSNKLAEDQFNRELRSGLEADRCSFNAAVSNKESELTAREQLVAGLREQFQSGFVQGRGWLAKFVADADRALDEAIAHKLLVKKRPAMKASEEVAEARAERRAYKERVKFLEYQLLSFKEYFPFLEEYEDLILDEAVELRGTDALEILEASDPVLRFVPKVDYDRLPASERNQMALDRYLASGLSKAQIGRMYERYLGYLYEQKGWNVEYQGIFKGYEDLGRDLICTKGNQVQIVQAKCWSAEKVIREKHIFQLFGTSQMYLLNHCNDALFDLQLKAVLMTTTSLSEVAQKAADWLKVEVRQNVRLDKTYPLIKCNVNGSSKIYHLPFDQQYDRTKIVAERGECYVRTVAEAEAKGFRRAFRYRPVRAAA